MLGELVVVNSVVFIFQTIWNIAHFLR